MGNSDPTPSIDTRRFLALLAGYFLLQAFLRLYLSDVLDLDEAEQMLLGQELRLGYNMQPPLYTWLQIALFRLLGPGLTALVLLKNLLLFLAYIGMWQAGRVLWSSESKARLAAITMVLLPQISWEAQRDLTHSVLALAAAAWTLCAFLRIALHRSPDRRTYVLLALALAAGGLAKYSFVLFAGPLFLAGLLDGETRARIWTRPVGLACAGAGLLALPHALWLLFHLGETAGQTVQKFGYTPTVAPLRSLWELGKAAFLFLTPLWLVFVLCFHRDLRGPQIGGMTAAAVGRRLLSRYLWTLAACLGAVAVAARADQFQDRWFLPMLFFAGGYGLLFVPQPSAPATRRFCSAVAAALVAILTATVVRVAFPELKTNSTLLNAPMDAVCEYVQREYAPDFVIAADNHLGGNLVHRLGSNVRVVTSDFRTKRPPGAVTVAVYRPRPYRTGPPTRLKLLLAEYGLFDPVRLDADRRMRLYFYRNSTRHVYAVAVCPLPAQTTP